MHHSSLRRPLWIFAAALWLGVCGLAAAEPPSRAARIGYIDGTVSFSPAGQRGWSQANLNRPLTTGDRLWSGGNSRTELQLGGTALRMGASTSMVLLNLDDRIAQLQLTQGSLKIHVRSLGPRQSIEVATPNLALTLRRSGEYRIEVDPDDDATVVRVDSGEAQVYGHGASYTINMRRAYRFYGTDLSDYETVTARRDDDLDRWSRERERRSERSISARYVSSEVVGYEDLDANGSWRVDASYGNVWTPRRVAAGWTPYRDGHWSWIHPWGWTWVDDAPWGFAVSHYGRWAHIDGGWAWVPGPRRERAVYAPALVAFVGGRDFQVSATVGSAAAVGWFPLAPREVYQPSYAVSRTYFDNINRSNAVIAPTAINEIYNTVIVNQNTTNITNITKVMYANQRVTGAVVAVPTQAFVQSQPVARAAVQLPREALTSAPVVRVVGVAPLPQSVQGGTREALAPPLAKEQPVVARTAPPPPPVPFAAQQAQVLARPGTPIDDAQRTQLKPAAPAVAPAVAPARVDVVAAPAAPAPTAMPPPMAPAVKSPEERKSGAARSDGLRGDIRRGDGDKAATTTFDAARAEAAKTAAAQADASRSAEAQAAAAKAEVAKAASARDEAAKVEAQRVDASRLATARADAAKLEAAKAEAMRLAATKAAADSAEAARAANVKAGAAKAEEARVERARGDGARADAVKSEAARADAAKAAADQAESARKEAAKAEATRADAARLASAKAEAAKVDAAKADAAKADAAAKAVAASAELAKAQAAKAAAATLPPAAAPPPPPAAPSSASALPPRPRASSPKSNADTNPDDEKKKDGRRL